MNGRAALRGAMGMAGWPSLNTLMASAEGLGFRVDIDYVDAQFATLSDISS